MATSTKLLEADLNAPTALAAPAPKRRHAWARAFGVYLLVLGASHFVAPSRWDVMTRKVMVDDIRRWTYRFGVYEAVLGVLVLNERTRLGGFVGLLAQGLFLLRRYGERRVRGTEQNNSVAVSRDVGRPSRSFSNTARTT